MMMDKDLKLSSLLEITKAINANLSNEKLLKLFIFVLKNQIKIERACVISCFENTMQISESYGIETDENLIKNKAAFESVRDIKNIHNDDWLYPFGYEVIIPVFHQNTPKAYVLLADMQRESDFKVSPIIKNARFIQTLANIVVVAIENRVLIDLRINQEKQNKELDLARQMQEMLIPKPLINHPAIELSAFYKPFEGVGGDYYDFAFSGGQKFTFCVGDISGKGIAAALLMANLQSQFRLALTINSSLNYIISQLNSKIIESTGGDKFVTLFLGQFDLETLDFTYINAGHPEGFLKRGKSVIPLNKGVPLLGIIDELPIAELESIKLKSGDIISSFTDGIFETENEEGEYFEMERLEQFFINSTNQSVKEMNLELMEKLQDFKGEAPFTDDIALLSIKII